MLTDFQNSFTGRLSSKFPGKRYINIPPHLKSVATLRHYLVKYECQRNKQRETCIMINDTSQHTVATWSSCSGTFAHNFFYKFTAECVLKEFVKSLNIWQSYGEKLIASSALCAGPLSSWKMTNSLEIWRMSGRNCFNSIMLRLILLTKLDFAINKYQTGVMSTTCK